MVDISVDRIFQTKGLSVSLGVLSCSVRVTKSTKELEGLLMKTAKESVKDLNTEALKDLFIIKNTRNFYKKIGKDPSRYRPSPEMLMRRIIAGKDLYYINNAVDAMNTASVKSSFPMGLYDLEKIKGKISFTIGENGENYKGIRKEIVNVEDLPLLKDEQGAFGNPTSDSERTMVTEKTKKLLLIVFAFGEYEGEITKTLELCKILFKKFLEAKKIKQEII